MIAVRVFRYPVYMLPPRSRSALVQLGIPAWLPHVLFLLRNVRKPDTAGCLAFCGNRYRRRKSDEDRMGIVKLALQDSFFRACLAHNTDLLLLDTRLQKRFRLSNCCSWCILNQLHGRRFPVHKGQHRIEVLVGGAYLLIDSGLVTDIAGIVICAVVYSYSKAAAKSAGGSVNLHR